MEKDKPEFKIGDQVQLKYISSVEIIAAEGECVFIRSLMGSHWVKATELMLIDRGEKEWKIK
jgi:hypothetical protein